MRIKIYLLIGILGIQFQSIQAQEVKFGKVSDEEMNFVYSQDTSAVATVLYRSVLVYYRYVVGDGFHLIKDVHERVRINSSNGYDFATVSEPLYKDNGKQEGISGLKGITYNYVNGKIEEYKLKKSDVFREASNEYYDIEKFTMPNVREGSIIEYQYSVDSPFYWTIDEIELQYDIPIVQQDIGLEIPEYLIFKPAVKGYLFLDPKYETKSKTINFNSRTASRYGGSNSDNRVRNSSVDYTVNVVSYHMEHVPALISEPYVNDMDNFRSSINYELQYAQFPDSPRENFTTSWEQVVERIYKSDNFGRQIDKTNYFKDDLVELVNDQMSDAEKAMVIFTHIQQHMNWNGFYGYYALKGVKNAYKEKTGNIGDINLALVSMLKEAGLKANPVLISTRDHGVPIFPTRDGFNYVIARVELEGQDVLLDASSDFSEPNLIPTRAINWFGKSVKEDGSIGDQNLFRSRASKEITYLNMDLHPDGSASGQIRNSFTDYRAYQMRNVRTKTEEEEYLREMESDNAGMEINEYKITNLWKLGKPITEQLSFDMVGVADNIADKIYFSPMFRFSYTENPFKLDQRNYPIDFAYPWQEKYVINVALPEGYTIESIPDSFGMDLPDQLGGFRYNIKAIPNGIQLMVDISMNQGVVPASYYPAMKELFENIVQKGAEKVVLGKTTADGNSTSAKGGR